MAQSGAGDADLVFRFCAVIPCLFTCLSPSFAVISIKERNISRAWSYCSPTLIFLSIIASANLARFVLSVLSSRSFAD